VVRASSARRRGYGGTGTAPFERSATRSDLGGNDEVLVSVRRRLGAITRLCRVVPAAVGEWRKRVWDGLKAT
jgi:hypothetical protein